MNHDFLADIVYFVKLLSNHEKKRVMHNVPNWSHFEQSCSICCKIFKVRLTHDVKRVRIRSYSGPHFSCIFPHSDWIRVFSPNAGKCGKNADQNNLEYGHFLRSGLFWEILHEVDKSGSISAMVSHAKFTCPTISYVSRNYSKKHCCWITCSGLTTIFR